MLQNRFRTPDHGAFLRFCASLLVVLVLAFPALAQENAPPPKAAEIESLVTTLEDDAARAKLVEQLRGLLAAQKATAAQEDQPGALAMLSRRIGTIGDDILVAAGTLRETPRFVQWVAAQAADAEARSHWMEVAAQLALIILAGVLAEKVAQAALSGVRRAAAPAEPGPLLVRIPLVMARAMVDMIPIAVFTGAGYGAVSLLGMGGDSRVAALTIITAYAGVRVMVALVRMVAAPRTPTLRLLPVGDETAAYLVIWVRRIAGVGLFGYFIADAARLLGLPPAGFNAVLKILGLVIAAMAVIFILQNRLAVAAWLRDVADRWDWGRRLRAVTNRLADIWHVMAIAYVGAVYVVWAIPIEGGFEFILRATLLSAVILAAAAVLATLIKKAVDRGFAISAEQREQFPELETRANRYLPVLHLALRTLLIVVTVAAVLQAWGLETFAWVASDLGRQVLGSAISIVIVVAVALLVWEVVSGGIERYLARIDLEEQEEDAAERSARLRTLLPLARNALMIALAVMVTLIVLSEVGVNIAPLLAGAGVVGIAIGFGSQKLVQDVITGAFILFEDTISVGDVVRVDGHAGLVEAISVRAIRLRDLNGNVHVIPFSSVGTVINMSKEFAYALIEAGVAYREDTDHVTGVLVEIGAEMRKDEKFGPLIVEDMEVFGVDRFDASAVIIRVRFKTRPLEQWNVTREFNRRMKKRFDELGIEIPFPQTTLWFGEDRQGEAPPMRLRVEDGATPQLPV